MHDSRRLRVLMVIEAAYPALNGGGAEAQVRTLSRALHQRRHRVTVVAPRLRWGPQEKVSRVDGVPVCRLTYPRLPIIAGPFMWLRMIGFLFSRRHRYDVWHVHIAHRLAAICAILGRLMDKRVVAKVSGWWELEKGVLAPGAHPTNRIAFKLLLYTDCWQAISRRIADTLVSRGIPPRRIAMIPNAVDTARFHRAQRDDEAPPRFIFIGRLEAEKGLHTLIDAFSDITPRFPDACLLLIGSGSLDMRLKEQVESLGIAGNVEFSGYRSDIETQLAKGNIGVLSSRIEGLSNTLLESMASGLPMVASRISGNEDFVRDGDNGWLFKPEDRVDLARCLALAASLSPADRSAMGASARLAVEQKAGLDRIIADLLSTYRGRPSESGVSICEAKP